VSCFPCGLSSIDLYGNSNKLRLPFSSVREEFITARAWEHLQYTGLRDTRVSSTGIAVRTGRKWRAAEAVGQAEACLKRKAPLGSVAQGRAGLGSSTLTQYNTASRKERLKMVQEEVRASVEER